MIMNKKIILVGGYCASGKSVFSRKLSSLLSIPCFNKDIIEEVLGDEFGS
jgi:dephospho-CoA kinase